MRISLVVVLCLSFVTAIRNPLLPRSVTAATSHIDQPEPIRNKAAKHHCEEIHEAKDPCKYAIKYCSPSAAGMVDYIRWYYCDMKGAEPVAFSVLVIWTALLFSTIGIASSDFFCPNLATIANSLGMSQSVAGVTLLAFGNGSPDVFSTFAAFKAHSGSLAIGELLGAAAFITSVVAGSMAIIAPFKVSKRSFLRDAGFFLIAVIMTMVLLADGRLRLWESILMIVFYVLYVLYVLIGTYYNSKDNRKKIINSRIRSQYAPVGQEQVAVLEDEFDEDANRLLEEDRQDIGALEAGPNDSEEEAEEHDYHDLNSSMSVTGRPMHTSQNSVRPSILGALEFRSLVTTMSPDGEINPTTVNSMKRRVRSHSSATSMRPEPSRKASSRTLSPQIAFTHQHNHMHKHASVRRGSQPLSVPITMSRSSSHSGNELPPEEIASSSLRKHNPIELLSPFNLDKVGEVEAEASETDLFAKSYAEAGKPSPVPSYESTSTAPSRPRVVIPEDSEDELEPKRSTPNWWPTSILPHPTDLKGLLLPTLTDFKSQTHTQRLLSILALPSVFLLTITLPVVNPPIDKTLQGDSQPGTPAIPPSVQPYEDRIEAIVISHDVDTYTAHRGWNRWLTSIQCILAPLLFTSVLFYTEPRRTFITITLISAIVGLTLLFLVQLLTTQETRPRFHTAFSWIGFAVSVTWISTIANEVVGTLQAFGTILGLSDAILGLTVFAVGNSLGDFVADVTVARMGFSQMAISGVFGGPMLNILMGIGISGIYINVSSHHVYATEISATLIVSAASLLTTLVVLLIAVPANKYVMSRNLGFVLYAIFLTGMIVSILVEVF